MNTPGGSMTKAELVEEVSRVSDLTKKHSEVIVDTVFKSIIDALHRGEKIELRGFGSFRLRKREPRKGRNPKTGDKVDVPPKKVPYFKPGKELKELINRAAEAAEAAEAAALVEFTTAGRSTQFWLGRNDSQLGVRKMETPGGPLVVMFGYERYPLGLSVRLADFHREANPESTSPTSCVSQVQLAERAGDSEGVAAENRSDPVNGLRARSRVQVTESVVHSCCAGASRCSGSTCCIPYRTSSTLPSISPPSAAAAAPPARRGPRSCSESRGTCCSRGRRSSSSAAFPGRRPRSTVVPGAPPRQRDARGYASPTAPTASPWLLIPQHFTPPFWMAQA